MKSLAKQNNNLLDSMVRRFGIDKQVTWNSTQAIDTRDLHAHLVLRDRAQFSCTGNTRIIMTARINLTANSCVAPISAVKVLFAFWVRWHFTSDFETHLRFEWWMGVREKVVGRRICWLGGVNAGSVESIESRRLWEYYSGEIPDLCFSGVKNLPGIILAGRGLDCNIQI